MGFPPRHEPRQSVTNGGGCSAYAARRRLFHDGKGDPNIRAYQLDLSKRGIDAVQAAERPPSTLQPG
jgi:hypothetical protein